jgi:hypothetical protein
MGSNNADAKYFALFPNELPATRQLPLVYYQHACGRGG